MVFQQSVDSNIQLITLDDSISDDLFKLISNNINYLSEWLVWPKYTKSVKDTQQFIAKSIYDFNKGKSMNCCIQYKDSLVGAISFNTISESLKKVQLGYWISANHQGRGIVTKSCETLIHHAFYKMNIEKVEVSIATENTASRNICERLDFKLEGIIRNSENIHGKIVDHAVYGKYKNGI